MTKHFDTKSVFFLTFCMFLGRLFVQKCIIFGGFNYLLYLCARFLAKDQYFVRIACGIGGIGRRARLRIWFFAE